MDQPPPVSPHDDRKVGTFSAIDTSFLAAAGFMALGTLLFTGSHGIVRWVGSGMHPLMMAFLSNLFSALFFVPWILRRGFRVMHTRRFPLHALRAMFNVASISCWYWALSLTPLADATALSATAPLFATLGAVLILGEPMKIQRWLALMVGLTGALIIVNPVFAEFSTGYIFVLGSCIFSSGSRIIAKKLSATDSPLACSAYVAMLQTPFSFVFALFVWTTPGAVQLGAMMIVGIMVALAQFLTVESFRTAEIGAVESFNYLRLLWAAIIGYVAFGEISGASTWIGAAVIVIATAFILRREAKAKRATAQP